MSNVKPTHDTANAKYMRSLKPSETYCFRCGYPHSMIIPHPVVYYFGVDSDTNVREKGLYILCETCHRLLDTWEARWPYYQMLLDRWKGTKSDIEADEKIELYLAVKSGS